MKIRQLIAILTLSVFGLLSFATPVYAQVNACTFIRPICDAIGLTTAGDPDGAITPGGAREFLSGRLQLILSLVFVAIILISVVIIIQNGLKYIQSQGDAKKIEDATKAIKTVFIGIGVLFVGIAGLVLVLFVFNGTGLLTPTDPGGDKNNPACTIDPITLELTCPSDKPTP